MSRAFVSPNFEIIQIPVLEDNYVYLIHSDSVTAVVDPALASPVKKVLSEKGWKLDYILNTHHHWDHAGANLELKAEFNCKIIGPKAEAKKIPGIDQSVSENQSIEIGSASAKIFDVPGHTLGHIAYWFSEQNALFCGDVIFSLGSGLLFEGTAEQMWTSLKKLRELPDDTNVFCAHEYTLDNAKFAIELDPDNRDLIDFIEKAKLLRANNSPTVPSKLGDEKKCNPFLRADKTEMLATLKISSNNHSESLGRIRDLKDAFDGLDVPQLRKIVAAKDLIKN